MAHSNIALSRGGWTLAAISVLSLWFLTPDLGTAISTLTGPDFAAAIVALALLTQIIVAAWVLLVVGLTLVLGSRTALTAVTPRIVRNVLFAGAAGALSVSPAQATHLISQERSEAPAAGPAVGGLPTHSLAGLRLPDRPQTAIARATSDKVVIVRSGDTLWSITKHWLPLDASEVKIAQSCAAWFDANRDVIGADRDFIIPGQHLTPPTKTPHTKDAA